MQRTQFISVAWLAIFMFCVGLAPVAAQSKDAKSAYKAPRTPDGQPDLQGTWTNATITQLLRNPMYGDKLVLTEQEAADLERRIKAMAEMANAPSDLSKELSPAGDGVGGYNMFWLDFGSRIATYNGEKRASIIVDPPTGQLPPLTSRAQEILAARQKRWAQGQFDHPEQRGLGERCLIGFGNTGGPPMLPVLYNNNYQIVQSKDHVMILVEMAHDARIIRLNGQHPPKHVRLWLGDSIGRWEGGTLVVETTNFHSQQGTQIGAGASYRSIPPTDSLKVIERFTRVGPDTINYEFVVEDPETFTRPWRGELPFHRTQANIFEYACHEGNYSLPGILAGEREKERNAAAVSQGTQKGTTDKSKRN